MDGSAQEYARVIEQTGIEEQEAERKYFHITEKMVYTIPEKGVAVILYPDDEFSVSLHVDYNSKVIGNQYATFNPGDDYSAKISPCRTFVMLSSSPISPSISGLDFSFCGTQNRRISAAPMPSLRLSCGSPIASPVMPSPAV